MRGATIADMTLPADSHVHSEWSWDRGLIEFVPTAHPELEGGPATACARGPRARHRWSWAAEHRVGLSILVALGALSSAMAIVALLR